MTRAKGRREMADNDNSDLQDTGFYNPFDGLKGRDGGPYLDADNRRVAELRRAAIEDREPADLFGVLPADAGTPLVIAAQLQDNSHYSNPSMAARSGFEAVLTDEVLAEADYNPNQDEVGFASPVSVLPVDYSSVPNEDNVVDQTIDGNSSIDGVNAAAADGESVTADAKANTPTEDKSE